MKTFDDYAQYYDMFYDDKDYAGEAAFVQNIIVRHSPSSRNILDLGCGSARHAVEMAKLGYGVTGVDISPQMIALASARRDGLPPELRHRIELVSGDATGYRPADRYAVITSLFHVANYQTSDSALRGLFETAQFAVAQDGLFIFDFWYGPAVLAQGPEVRSKLVERSELRVTRLGEPTVDTNSNLVTVKYTLTIDNLRNNRTDKVQEVHRMRYLFLPEIEAFTAAAGFELVECGEWLTRRPLSPASWSGYAVVRPSERG